MKKILIPALLCLTFAAGCTCENTIRRRADVLVIGGTTSGTTAAIAAARLLDAALLRGEEELRKLACRNEELLVELINRELAAREE